MKTGDRHSEVAGGGTRSDENVVRFPRDWVGPLDELLPIGPLPRTAASSPDSPGGAVLPPSADAFWGEDSAALHDAVISRDDGAATAPPLVTPPAGAVPPSTTSAARNARLRGLGGPGGLIPRPHLIAGLRHRIRLGFDLVPRARLVAGVCLVAAVTLLAMTVIGYAESGGAHRITRARVHPSPAPGRGTATDAALRPATKRLVHSAHRPRGRRHVVRARAHARHHVRQVHHAARASVTAPIDSGGPTTTSTGTGAAGNSQSGAATGSGPTTVDSHPVSTPPPAAPAFGQQGTLGPGSSSDS